VRHNVQMAFVAAQVAQMAKACALNSIKCALAERWTVDKALVNDQYYK
jgi:hypothetical protein